MVNKGKNIEDVIAIYYSMRIFQSFIDYHNYGDKL